jgi:hypothetical protein
MQPNYNHIFPNLPDSSRVWIYQNQAPISKEVQGEIQQKLDAFVRQWAAHKVQLYGDSIILEDYFIILAVDENMTAASGCSIDSSVHFIKELAKEFDLKLFDRLNVLIEENGEKQIIHYSDLNKHTGATFFDPMITTLGDFRSKWKVVV